MMFSIRRKHHRDIPELRAARVKVGFPAGSARGNILDIAIWNHFGTRTIPERPFLDNAIRDNALKYRQAMRKSAPKIIAGETSARAVMSKLGPLAQRDIQEEINNLQDPPNAPATIKAKGSSNPLIDKGTMRGSVTWKVEE